MHRAYSPKWAFYDRDGNAIIQMPTPVFSATGIAWIDYTAPSGKRIGIIYIKDGGGDSYVDNLFVWY